MMLQEKINIGGRQQYLTTGCAYLWRINGGDRQERNAKDAEKNRTWRKVPTCDELTAGERQGRNAKDAEKNRTWRKYSNGLSRDFSIYPECQLDNLCLPAHKELTLENASWTTCAY
ncbi:MAG: hypothetical protein WKF89_06245 [Chitinophagaceae bacterium]